jgi:AraC-like DNA-binding protein
MPHNRTKAFDTAMSPVAPYYVRRVERYIEDHVDDDIGLSDLAGVASVSARALQMGFRRFRHSTPMAYLRAIRMELARSQLAGAGERNGSVAQVANELELGNLGRFARDYRARFGESPSDTFRRRR